MSKKDSDRIVFVNKECLNAFFYSIKIKFKSIKSIRKNLNIAKSTLENYMSGKYTIPRNIFEKLLKKLDISQQKYFLKYIYYKDKNWGRSKGGNVTYSKYKSIFELGRKKAIIVRNGNKKRKYNFNQNISLSKELAELIGALIGDGFIGNYNKKYIIHYTGDKILDKQYFKKLQYMYKSIEKNINPLIFINSYRMDLRIHCKDLFLMLKNRFNIPVGVKCYTVTIPKEILNANKEIVNACIRGIFDTDGGVIFDKRKSYTRPYMRISLQMMSIDLIRQIHYILQEQGINSRVSNNGTRIQINGKYCKNFIDKIGFSNIRHLKKINLNYFKA